MAGHDWQVARAQAIGRGVTGEAGRGAFSGALWAGHIRREHAPLAKARGVGILDGDCVPKRFKQNPCLHDGLGMAAARAADLGEARKA